MNPTFESGVSFNVLFGHEKVFFQHNKMGKLVDKRKNNDFTIVKLLLLLAQLII